MSMKTIVGLVVTFAIVSILGFLTIGWVASVPEPADNTSVEGQVYENQTETMELAFVGQEAVLILIAVAMVFSGFFLIIKVIK